MLYARCHEVEFQTPFFIFLYPQAAVKVFVQVCKITPFAAVHQGVFLFGGDVAFFKAQEAGGVFLGVIAAVYQGGGFLGVAA